VELSPFDEDINNDDMQIKAADIKLLVDAMSFQYLKGATIDYTEGVEGAQFTINNPNAKTTCGCGSSFSMDDEDDA
jgi:iron-sulfur cluster insertion protein